MAGMNLSAQVDTSVLNGAILELDKVSRRSLHEQAVTSIGWICSNAQKLTDRVSVARMDGELEVMVSGVTKAYADSDGARGRLSTAKKPRYFSVASGQASLATMIVLARMHPAGTSKSTGRPNYNQLTRSYWKLDKPATKGSADFWNWVSARVSRMVLARHSSGNFLKHGWVNAIRAAFDSPFFQHSAKYRSANKAMSGELNLTNRKDMSVLGDFSDASVGDTVNVTSWNNIGQGSGNSTLDAKHRTALLLYGQPALQTAVDNEASKCLDELARRLADGYKPVQARLN